MITKEYARGQIIFRQDDYSDCMYEILEGKVGVFDAYGTENEKLIAELGKGQSLGEMGMLEYYPRSATAVALEDGTSLAEITEDELNDYLLKKPEKLLSIMRQLSERIRETNRKYMNACRVVYENDEAEKSGREKSDELKKDMEMLAEFYGRALY